MNRSERARAIAAYEATWQATRRCQGCGHRAEQHTSGQWCEAMIESKPCGCLNLFFPVDAPFRQDQLGVGGHTT